MADDKPELSSDELIRQAREALGVPRMQAAVAPQISSHVEGPSIQDLLAKPLSSDSLLPQRAVDPWAEDEDEVDEPWEPIDRTEAPAPPAPIAGTVRKRRNDPQTGASALPPLPPQPAAVQWAPEEPLAPWLEPMRDELGLPPAPPRAVVNETAPRPLGPSVEPRRRAGIPWRFLIAGFIALSVLVGSFVDDDSRAPQSSQVEVGDCYESSNFSAANSVDCADLHRVQIFALLNVDPSSGQAVNSCFNAAVSLRDSGTIPATTVVPDGTFVGAIGTSSTTPASTFCYFESPVSGLIGSVLPG